MIEKLKKAFEGDLAEYRSIPFWSWNNQLDESALLAQIDEMKKVGIGGFIMHARTGLTTEYLGEKWFSCVKACLRRAKELGMQAWIYDENGWPSGFVGGKLLENEAYRARFLEYSVRESFDADAFVVYISTGNGYQRVTSPVDTVQEYYCIYLRVSPSNTDILNPEVVQAFIAETHEKYYERFQESFGKELVGFFTDEPQYYRWSTPYPVKVADRFLEKYGEDVRDGLIYLFVHDTRGYGFRTRYFTTLNEMYVNTFYKALYDWCEAHGCMLTGHSVEEPHLFTQMWGGGGVMPTYEYQHIPGVDSLGFYGEPILSARQVGTVAAQLDKRFVLTETFGCAGYDVTPVELRHIAELQYFNGVNVMCQHLLPYSIAGQGKHDHPPVFYKQNNWWEESKEFNEYFARLGYIIANTKDVCDVLVVHPMRCVYLDYIRSEDYESVKELEQSFAALLSKLNENGVTYHLADETLLNRHGKIEDGKLIIGSCAYDKIILPKMLSVSSTTLEILKNYTQKLCVLDKIEYVNGEKQAVELQGNCDLQNILSDTKIAFQRVHGTGALTIRANEWGEFLFIKNHSAKEPFVAKFPDAENYVALDLESMQTTEISSTLTVEKGAGLLLIKRGQNVVDHSIQENLYEDITADFAVNQITDNYFVMDFARLSFDGVQYGEEEPLLKIFENLLYKNYRGKIYIKQTFSLGEQMPLKLMVEENRFLSATLNGNSLQFVPSEFDIRFCEADITPYVHAGENEYVYSIEYYQRDLVRFALFDPLATEAVRNCLYYDTYLENSYLKGDFVVESGCLRQRKGYPALSTQWYKSGYPFFYGAVSLRGEYRYDGVGERALALGGRFAVANIRINGKQVNLVMDTKKDVTSLLQTGSNEIEITVKSSLRNLMGPHHNKHHQDPNSVGPATFTMYTTWKDGVAEQYQKEYSLVPFGVEAIKIIK